MQPDVDILIRKCEQEHQIKIIYACESGSRSWGFPSADSDFDIRFIYVRQLNDYLSIHNKKDTIDFPIVDLIDLGEWDIKKVLYHVHQSNPVIHEWFCSPIVYKSSPFKNKLTELTNDYFDLQNHLKHYIGLAKSTLKRVGNESTIRLKDYFYILRPIISLLWLKAHQKPAPMNIEPLLDFIQPKDPTIVTQIKSLMVIKLDVDESFKINKISLLDQWVQENLEYLQKEELKFKNEKRPIQELDQFFFKLINENVKNN